MNPARTRRNFALALAGFLAGTDNLALMIFFHENLYDNG